MKTSLKKIGEPKPNKAIPHFPSGFHSSPKSLKAAMHAMNPPLIESWVLAHTEEIDNMIWKEECQGITTDGDFWYIISNNEDKRALYKYRLDFSASSTLEFPEEHHIGQPAFGNGKIFVPVEGEVAKVWVVNTSLVSQGIFDLGGNPPPQGGGNPWCAFHPWNGFLYSSTFDNVDRVFAYDPNNNFAFQGELRLQGNVVNSVQGGCFSKNGHLYLTSDSTEDIRAYSAFNGAFLGSCKVPYDKSTLEAEEMEGIALGHIIHSGNVVTFVHVIILDNDWPSGDEVFFKHYAVPDENVI